MLLPTFNSFLSAEPLWMLTIKCPHCATAFAVHVHTQALPECSPPTSPSPVPTASSPDTSSDSSSEFSPSSRSPSPAESPPSVSAPRCEKEVLGSLRQRSGLRRSARIREYQVAQLDDDFGRTSASDGVRRSRRLKRLRRSRLHDTEGSGRFWSTDSDEVDEARGRPDERTRGDKRRTASPEIPQGDMERDTLVGNSDEGPVSTVPGKGEAPNREVPADLPEVGGVDLDISNLGDGGGWVEHSISPTMRRALGVGRETINESESHHRPRNNLGAIKAERCEGQLRTARSNLGYVKMERCDATLPAGVGRTRPPTTVKQELQRKPAAGFSVVKREER
ncbi:hypothetical protein FOZ62_024368 [Perkinsus olseni]|uniref:Uncharacterized protein n=1 Tax=Perkinsus olseni TaxID=32597 RepID=A0A7J6RCJ6_PEROL|nr:hypothetical protein FOZ62_024368 [Perkinsus olseni]